MTFIIIKSKFLDSIIAWEVGKGVIFSRKLKCPGGVSLKCPGGVSLKCPGGVSLKLHSSGNTSFL